MSIKSIEIREDNLLENGKSFGDVGQYREIKGIAKFILDPKDEYNKKYPSMSDGMRGNTFKKEPQQYTGTLVKGIAQMHKSNAVPIINKEQAVEVAKMRRG